MVEELAKNAKVPMTLHLDYHEEFIQIKESVDSGCRSVMIDSSGFEIEEDARYTNPKQAVVFIKETDIDSLTLSVVTAHG